MRRNKKRNRQKRSARRLTERRRSLYALLGRGEFFADSCGCLVSDDGRYLDVPRHIGICPETNGRREYYCLRAVERGEWVAVTLPTTAWMGSMTS